MKSILFLLAVICGIQELYAQEDSTCYFINSQPVHDCYKDGYYVHAGALTKPGFPGGYNGFVRFAWDKINFPREIADTMRRVKRVMSRFLITPEGKVIGREVWEKKDTLTSLVAHFLEQLKEFTPGYRGKERLKTEIWVIFFFTKNVRYPFSKNLSFIPIFPAGTGNLDAMARYCDHGDLFFKDSNQ